MIARGGETGGSALGAVQVVGAEVDVVEFNVILDVGSYRLFSLYHQRSSSSRVREAGTLTWTCNFPKYSPNSFCFCGPISLKSWSRNTTTPRSAIRRASSFFCASVSWDNCSPLISVPIRGVSFVTETAGSFVEKRCGLALSAKVPLSTTSNGSVGGKTVVLS